MKWAGAAKTAKHSIRADTTFWLIPRKGRYQPETMKKVVLDAPGGPIGVTRRSRPARPCPPALGVLEGSWLGGGPGVGAGSNRSNRSNIIYI